MDENPAPDRLRTRIEPPAFTARPGGLDAVFFLASALFIYLHIFQLPATPIYFDGDSMATISNSVRLLDGEVMYRDFFHLTPPGAEVVYAALFTAFGVKVWVVNLTLFVLGFSLTGLIWYLSRQLLTGSAVFLPAAIFLVIGYRQSGIDGSYRLFSMVFALAAVAVLVRNRSIKNLILAGCLAGLSSFFVQPRGVLVIVGLLGFPVWANWPIRANVGRLIKSGAALLAAFISIIVLTQAYFAVQAGFDVYYHSLVTFPATYYSSDRLNNLAAYFSDIPPFPAGSIAALPGYLKGYTPLLFYYLLIPAIYVVTLYYILRKARYRSVPPPVMLLLIVGMILALGISAPTSMRLYQVSAPGLVLAVWLCGQNVRLSRILPIILIGLSALGGAYAVQRQLVSKSVLEMPAGNAAFLSQPTYARYAWMRDNTTPGDLVYEPHHPNFYFPFHLKNPTPLHTARDSDYTPAFQVEAVVEGLERTPPRLMIWPQPWSRSAGRAPGDNLEPLWQFVKTNYTLKHVFVAYDDPIQTLYGDTEIWELRH